MMMGPVPSTFSSLCLVWAPSQLLFSHLMTVVTRVHNKTLKENKLNQHTKITAIMR